MSAFSPRSPFFIGSGQIDINKSVPLIDEEEAELEPETHTDDEIETDAAEQRAVEAFEPKSHGKWGRNMWKWYFCGGIGSCCDADHLSMHIFFLSWLATIIMLVVGLSHCESRGAACSQDITTNRRRPPYIEYFGGLGMAAIVWFWSCSQFRNFLKYRMNAAELLDGIVDFKLQRKDLDINIAVIRGVRKRLANTHLTTLETSKALRSKFRDFRKWTHESQIINEQSSNIGLLLRDKMIMRMEQNLREQVIASERGVMETIYNTVQLKEDNEYGLNKQEFVEFVNKLPVRYRERFKLEVGEFDELAGNDGIIDRQELFGHLDRFTEDAVTGDTAIQETNIELEVLNVSTKKQ